MHFKALADQTLREHGNAVLSLPIPRWEKHYAEHSRALWSSSLAPLLEQTSHVELVRPEPTAQNRHRIAAHLGLVGASRAVLLEKWLSAIASEGDWDCYLLMATTSASVYASPIIEMTTGVGFFDKIENRFSREMRKSIALCLSKAELAVAFGPPPFRSAYLIAKISP
jgi:hypothetical protein